MKILLLIELLVFVESKQLIDYINPQNIVQNLRDFTKEPHVAGTPGNKRVAEKIMSKWKQNGLEDVHFDTYKVLLSYPNFSNPNHFRLMSRKGEIMFESSGISPAIIPKEQGAPNAGIQWLAYSANGSFIGQPIYCNYGTEKDFKLLKKMGVSLKNKIAIIRYGSIFRGNKIKLAQDYGASAAILFSDPKECAPNGTEDEHVYPNTEFMPSYGSQQGTLTRGIGDSLTSFYPAKNDLYSSVTINEIKKLQKIPSIPVLPLSYGDAYHILSRMHGKKAPDEWQGGLKFTYNIGDEGLQDGESLEIEVHSFLEKRTIRNVIGYIRGIEEPDRYVLLGNHFDAWVYGSIDPNSGTAILSEVARAMVEAKKDGIWHPRRTLIFCNWDGEEHGLIGSTEFVEYYQHKLNARAVTYLNVDLIYGNATFRADTFPTMFDVIVNNAKQIPNPMKSEVQKDRKTVYDTWINELPGQIEDRPEFPELNAPGGSSDHERFMSYLGVPVADIRYIRRDKNPITKLTYPLYHSLYETPFVNEHIFDHDNFAVHTATGQYWANLALTFSEQRVLPLNASMLAHMFLNRYAKDLKKEVSSLSERINGMDKVNQQVNLMIRDVQELVRRAYVFHSIDNNQLANELRLRSFNDRLMEVDRCFVITSGIPEEPLKRNILFSTSNLNNYDSKVMIAVYQQIGALKSADTESEQLRIIELLTEQISIVQFSIKCAANSLDDLL